MSFETAFTDVNVEGSYEVAKIPTSFPASVFEIQELDARTDFMV